MSIVRCIAKLNRELRDFNTSELRDAAAAYKARNLEEREANIKAVEDHLRDLTQQRARMVDQVHEAWKARDPEGYKAAQPAEEAAPKPSRNPVLTDEDRAEIPFERTAMKRSEPHGGMEAKAVEDIARKITATWKNAPEVVVVDSLSDSRVPLRVREIDQAQRAQGAEGQPAAFFYGDKVYLVASESKSPKDVTTYLFHEALGHYGLRGVFGDKLDNVLRMVASARRAEVEAKAAAYGLDMKNPDHVLSAAEEVLAELAQKRPEISFVKRAVAVVRSYLRELGLDIDLTDADIIHNFITPARDFVERGKAKAAESHAEPAFARTAEAKADPEDLRQTPTRGKLYESVKDITKSWVEELQKAVTPMAAGSDRARAVAKDFANAERLAREQWAQYHDKLTKTFKPEQLKKMWDAADEQNVLMQQGKPTAGKGLDTLEPKERQAVEQMHAYANGLLAQAKEVGMFKGEGLPYWTPRVVANIGKDGEFLSEPGKAEGSRQPFTSPTGKNITTTASSLKHREHLTAAETEAAAKAKFGDDAQVVRDIRTMPMAMARLERAIAGRKLIESIREIGRKSGEEVVASGEKPGFFTVDSPAFKTYRPKFEDVDGKMQAVTDAAGNVVMDRVPLYIANEFEGPLKSIMSDKPGKIYSGLMTLKSKATGLIMYSPLIHNGVEWGRALPLMPGKVATFRVYFEGNAARKDGALMRELVEGGMVPIGKRFQNQDISGIVEEPNLKPGRSWTAQALGGATGLVSKTAGEVVKRGVDKAGDVWHNTLLWDRVADLQAGIALNMRDEYMAKGMDRQTATRMASHLANRFAGALPNESMSAMARKTANLSLFSRTFTLGNMGVMKDMFTGLPKDVQAQIRRDAGVVAAQGAVSAARRTAIHAFVLDIALMYAANAALQSAFDYWKRDKSLDDISKGYVDRMNRMFDRVKESPSDLLNVFGNIQSLSPTSENEPGKENRVLFGYANDGTAIYVRIPTGKIGEEFTDWPTSPLDMLKRKESTLLRPTLQLLQNDKGFGREVYDAKAKGITGAVTNMGRIAWNYMNQQLPMDSIKAAGDLMKARGDDDVNALKVVGPLFGVTFSKGAPGGPATGQLMEVNREHTAQIRRAMPDVRELIKDGKTGEALAAMDKAGFTPAEKRTTLRFATNPGVITQRRMEHYNQIASPEEIEAMRRMRQSSADR